MVSRVHYSAEDGASVPVQGVSGGGDEMVEGYFDGLKDHRNTYPAQTNRSPEYGHGWRNGRDDRTRNPRATAQVLRQIAANITQEPPQ